jgi:hypothetical protein
MSVVHANITSPLFKMEKYEFQACQGNKTETFHKNVSYMVFSLHIGEIIKMNFLSTLPASGRHSFVKLTRSFMFPTLVMNILFFASKQ